MTNKTTIEPSTKLYGVMRLPFELPTRDEWHRGLATVIPGEFNPGGTSPGMHLDIIVRDWCFDRSLATTKMAKYNFQRRDARNCD